MAFITSSPLPSQHQVAQMVQVAQRLPGHAILLHLLEPEAGWLLLNSTREAQMVAVPGDVVGM